MASDEYSSAKGLDSTGWYPDPGRGRWERHMTRQQPDTARRRSDRVKEQEALEERRNLNEEVLADIACDPRFWGSDDNRVQSRSPGAWQLDPLTQSGDGLVDMSDLGAPVSDPPETQAEIEEREEAIMVRCIHPARPTGLAESELLSEAARRIQEDGFTPLIGALLEIEKRAGHHLSQDLAKNSMAFKEVAMQVLCGMYEETIPLLVQGTLYGAYLRSAVNGDGLKDRLDRCRDRANKPTKHPAIYVRACVDEDGRAMTGWDARRICRYIERYISTNPGIQREGRNHFCKADQYYESTWTQAQTDAGERRFLQTQGSERSAARVEVVKRFTRAVKARVNACEDELVPMEPPLQYCGYSSEFDRRDQQHSSYGSSSSWLTSLFMSFARCLFGPTYEMKALCVFLIGEEAQGPISEIIITRLSSAYYHTGGGFSIGLAGASMTSLHMTRLTREERAKAWRGHQEALNNQTHYGLNMGKEMNRMVAYRKKQVNERTKKNERELDYLRSGLGRSRNGVQRDNQAYESTKAHPTWKKHQALAKKIATRAEAVKKVPEQPVMSLTEQSSSPSGPVLPPLSSGPPRHGHG